MTATQSSRAPTARQGLTTAQVGSLLAPQRRLLVAIAACVLAGAALEVLPPLLVRQAVDAHLAGGRGDGLMLLGVLYLLVVAGQQALGFASAYGTAIAAQRALRDLRADRSCSKRCRPWEMSVARSSSE